MKKLIALIVLAALMLSMLTGCGSTKEVDLKAVMNDINAQYADSTSELRELTDVSELQGYYSISPEDVSQFAAEIKANSADAPVEIVLVEAKDSDSAANVRTALERRYQSIVSQYASYSPEQLAMANECEVTQNGNIITMIVSYNYSEMISIVNAAIE